MQQLTFDWHNFFPAQEGEIDQYFGKIRNGKTYIATADAYKDLCKGKIVYANWHIQWQGYDERKSKWHLFWGALGIKRVYKKFPKENFHYLPVDANFFSVFETLTDCIVYLDEGHIAFDSYEMAKMDIGRRAAVLHTGHYDRTIKIISQRPTAIHVTLRANVNRFFQCVKIIDLKKIPLLGRFLPSLRLFKRVEYQETTGQETVDLTMPEGTRFYWGKKKVYELYNTKYLRGDTPDSQPNFAQMFRLGAKDALRLLSKKGLDNL